MTYLNVVCAKAGTHKSFIEFLPDTLDEQLNLRCLVAISSHTMSYLPSVEPMNSYHHKFKCLVYKKGQNIFSVGLVC